MRNVLHVLKCIILLAYLVVLVLCCHSCIMTLVNNSLGPAADSGNGTSPLQAGPVSTPVPTPSVRENEVILSSGIYQDDIESLSAVVTPSDLSLLDSFTALRSADFSGSSCYPEIIAWSGSHPDISVRYTVQLPDGQALANDAASVDLSGMDPSLLPQAASMLQYLPGLQTIELGLAQGGVSIPAETLAQLAASCPNANIHYALSLLGREVSLSDTELDLSSMTADQVGEAASVIRSMSSLQLIHLGAEGGGLGWDSIAAIHDAAPNAVLDYAFNLWGVDTNLSAESLSLSHIKMNDQGAAVRNVLPYMVNLRSLDMDSCDVSNDAMAAIRNDFPKVDVIWRIWFAGYSVRTDVERILASSTARGGTVTDEEAAKLQYCNHVKYLDLGHNREITDISFVRGMPDLEVLIIAINDVSDISPLADCPKLEYLEINSTNVTDLTPLSNATALRHLNIGRTAKSDENTGEDLNRPRVSDISPLFGLSDLQRLWIGSLNAEVIPKEQIDKMAEVMHVDDLYNDDGSYNEYSERINVTSGDPSQGTWRTTGERPDWVWEEWLRTGVFNDPLNERYTLLREQFQYDLGSAAYSLPQNDPLY